ncbi:MAG TPA: HD-GYP domain-containing protein, partial [Geobacteraceae bacterium]|nr:HD-GYP domain-containing protein [Geobacteraceae bacterium]
ASAIDAKDPYTYGHSRRVAQISEAICRELGMPGEEIQSIELAALLHDIGKIGTPEHILQKPGRLRPKEMEIIKEHPQQGAHILSTIDELQEVMAWIRHHHERYDGRGYPDKSMAEEIPLPARIIAIADSYDAMTSDRPYRKAMNPIKVMDIMDDLSGSQFDPYVFNAFKAVIMRKGA